MFIVCMFYTILLKETSSNIFKLLRVKPHRPLKQNKPTPKCRRPKDPSYLKDYYREDVTGVKTCCDYCSCDIAKDKYHKHQKSARRLRLLNKEK